jgi:PKD repeat protein
MTFHLLENRSSDIAAVRCFRSINRLILLCASLLLPGITTLVEAGSITVEWDPVSDQEVTHYEICYGLTPGQYGSPCAKADADGRDTSTKTVSGLIEGEEYYLAARSANGTPGVYSSFSNEIRATIPTTTSPPAASFSATPTSGTSPLTVTFSDTSTGEVTSRSWDFGNGDNSTEQTVSSTYESVGTYTVRLTVTGPGGTDTETKTDYITVVAATGGGGNGGDVYQQDSGAQGLLVMEAEHFAGNVPQGGHEWIELTDPTGFSGSGAMRALPDIGVLNNTDYVGNSPRLDFNVNFAKSGTHYVWLRGLGTNSSGNSAHLGLDGQANTSADRIDFSATGNWIWTNDTMDAVRATLDVPTPGEHTVNVWMREDGLRLDRVLLATDASFAPSGTGPAESPIQTGSAEAPVASFSATPTSGTAPLTVTFSDTSTGGEITSRSWSFGDGGTSTGQTAIYEYQTPGTYPVSLTVTGPGGTDTATANIVVEAPAPTASFSATPISGTAPLTVTFSDTSTGEVTSRSWDFGNGDTSIDPIPPVTSRYDSAGTYSVSLTVTGPGGTDTETKTDYITVVAATGGGAAGLVAAYGFEEPSGTQVIDSSEGANHGTISGAVRTTSGKHGSALSFDGIDDWVTINDSPSLDLTTGMTLEAWLYPTATTGWRTAFMKETSDSLAYTLNANSGTYQPSTSFRTSTNWARLFGPTGLPPNEWTHLAATYDGATHRFFVNGAEVDSSPQTGSILQSNGVLRIGGNANWQGEFFQGHLDEIRIYNRALSPGEIQADMVNPVVAAPAEPALVKAGEIAVDDQWQRITLTGFVDPVVVAKPLSFHDPDPAVVRMRNLDATGFEIRIQEWDYLDGAHAQEIVGYLVMERGHHVLPDGTEVEAGSIATDRTGAFDQVSFDGAFPTTPVVFTSVATRNEADAVDTRVEGIGNSGFQVGMQEQEANTQSHASETLAYIAWEPSAGTVDGLDFEVGRTSDSVTDDPFTIPFGTVFAMPPVLLADMQTADGGNTGNLRWQNESESNVEIWVAEEQSNDSEIRHPTEVVGYGVFELAQ